MIRARAVILLAGAIGAPVGSAEAQRARVDSSALERLVDSVLANGMASERIPGAAFCFVQGGRVTLCKGYGLAQVAERRAVSPETTIFRVGSISKVFTAMAVVQLADRGHLNMTADVNRYLTRLQLPVPHGPVTAEHLLSHTAGFDEIRPGTQVADPASVLSLADFLRPRLVPIHRPGEITSYSTYGITIAGLLVEELSGTGFEEYLARNIWQPLGMTRSSITVPAVLRPDVAVGYELAGDSLRPQAWEWYHTTPASSVNATPMDMARFMIALLDTGTTAHPVLSPRARQYLQRQHATAHPRVPGFALGLYEDYVGQLRTVEHGGNMAGYSSLMVLIPSHQAGLFYVGHRENSGLRDVVKETLLSRLFPEARVRLPVPAPDRRFKARVSLFTGRYAPTTSCHSCSPRRLPYVLDVRPSADSSALVITGREWLETEPFLFVRRDGTGYIHFRPDSTGRVAYMFAGNIWSFDRLPQQ